MPSTDPPSTALPSTDLPSTDLPSTDLPSTDLPSTDLRGTDPRGAGSDLGETPPSWWRTRSGLVLCGFLAIAAFWLLTEHTAHVFGALPWLLFAACPLM